MKTCKTCQNPFPDDKFYAGISHCKECWKAYVRQRRLTNPSVRKYDVTRAKTTGRRERAREYTKRWREENPGGYKAHNAVSNAVRDGRLEKLPCSICGTNNNIHAHHKDYEKPLDVVWLCARCHHRLHTIFPELEGANKVQPQ